MRTALASAAIGMLLGGCEESDLITKPNPNDDASSSRDAGVADLSFDASDGGCEDGCSGFTPVCAGTRCVECTGVADAGVRSCADNPLALGVECSSQRCVCENESQCTENPNGPRCIGYPRFCGCTEGADCSSGICEPDPYVGGSVCRP